MSSIRWTEIKFHPPWMVKDWTANLHEIQKNTLTETNIAPENRPSQKETSLPTSSSNHPFSGAKMLVSGRLNTKTTPAETIAYPCQESESQEEEKKGSSSNHQFSGANSLLIFSRYPPKVFHSEFFLLKSYKRAPIGSRIVFQPPFFGDFCC